MDICLTELRKMSQIYRQLCQSSFYQKKIDKALVLRQRNYDRFVDCYPTGGVAHLLVTSPVEDPV
jgi:hypothetical protein